MYGKTILSGVCGDDVTLLLCINEMISKETSGYPGNLDHAKKRELVISFKKYGEGEGCAQIRARGN